MANLLRIDDTTDRGSSRDANGRSAHRTFQQWWDSVPTVAEIEVAAGMPVIGTPHPDFPELACSKINKARNLDYCIYEVPVDYSSTVSVWEAKTASPLTDPWQIKATSEPRPRVATVAVSDSNWMDETVGGYDNQGYSVGDIIATPAWERFDPPVQESRDMRILQLEKNYAPGDVSLDALDEYLDSINKTPIIIAGRSLMRWTGKMQSIDVTGPMTDRNVTYYTITYRIACIYANPTVPAGVIPDDSWCRRLQNAGFMCLRAAGGTPVNIVNKFKVPLKKPVTIEQDGTFDPDVSPQKSNWLMFCTLREVEWSTLGLPATMPV